MSPTCTLSGAAKHFQASHNGDLSTFQVTGIEQVYKSAWGGDWNNLVLHREAFWILKHDIR